MATLPQPIDAYLAQLSSIQTHDTTTGSAQITAPTLVLAGEEDILIPVAPVAAPARRASPGSQWATVPGGHACLWEHPEPFNEAVLDSSTSASRLT